MVGNATAKHFWVHCLHRQGLHTCCKMKERKFVAFVNKIRNYVLGTPS